MQCEICGRQCECARHHVFFGSANRKLSEKYNMVAWLCPDCHQYGPRAVHRCREADLILKQRYQRIFEAEHGSAVFMEVFKRNYL
jgi:predicted RNA-binding Zn-ribbon protein involved in translation (DUF1610 family)